MTRLLNALEALVGAGESTDGKAVSPADAATFVGLAAGAAGGYLVYGEDGAFRKVGDADSPAIKSGGYWVINRHLAASGGNCAFNVVDSRAVGLTEARPGLSRSHVATLLPMAEGASEMLVLYGLGKRLTRSGLALTSAAAPVLAQTVAQEVDAARKQRLQHQINAIADVAQVLTKSQTKEDALSDLCTAIAGASGLDIVAIAAFRESEDAFAYRALNTHRYWAHQAVEAYTSGVFDGPMIAMAKAREPWYRSHLAAPDSGVEETGRRLLVSGSLFASMAGLPLIFRDELLGIMTLSSFRPHDFGPDERMMLESLAAQAVTIVKGLNMYEELRVSRERLETSSSRLRESMSIEYRLARTDALTGLPNRRYLDEALSSEFAQSARRGSMCLVMADVDRFKEINDRHGHAMGDDVLKVVGSVAWRTRNQGAVVGRYGGDEFLFIVPGRSAESGYEFAERFRSEVERTRLVSPSGETVGVTVSVGVAETDADRGCTFDEGIQHADEAMYEAKRAGGNGVSAGERVADSAPA